MPSRRKRPSEPPVAALGRPPRPNAGESGAHGALCGRQQGSHTDVPGAGCATGDPSVKRDRAILVIGPSWVGDLVMAQTLLSALRQTHPGVAIDMTGPRALQPLAARMPDLRRWVEASFPRGHLGLGARWRLAAALRDGYEAAYVLPGSWKSALVPFFARIPRRVGYRGEWRYGLLNDCRRLPREERRRTARAFFALADGGAFTPPHLHVDEANRDALLGAHGLSGAAPFVAMMPGAEFGPAKRWPSAHYATLALRLMERGNAVALLGSAGDAAAGAAIAALAPGVVDLCGRTTLADAVDLLSAARLAVSNDSGLLHVAAAVGTPIVGLYGSTSPDDTPPLTTHRVLLTRRLSCSPCHARACPLGHHACLEGLPATDVLAALDGLEAAPA